MSTLTWITEKELEREIKNWMLEATKVKMSGSKKNAIIANRNIYSISSTIRVTSKIHVFVIRSKQR